MAAVLDALVPYVKKMIADLSEEEVFMLLGVSGEIYELENNTESIRAFLADAERRRITDQSVQRWVSKLKNAMYDATDILDLCQLGAERSDSKKGSHKEKVPCCFHPLLFHLRNPAFSHGIGRRIKELNQRLQNIHMEAARFNFSIGLGSNPKLMMDPRAEYYSPKATSEFDESAIVGEKIERDAKELIQMLIVYDDSDIRVVSLVGMGGMGKTTLAQKIFRDTNVQEHFKMRIWLTITQQFDEAELLSTAIEYAWGDYLPEYDLTLLMRTFTKLVSTGRFLLVMDDMWSEQAWSDLLSVPIRNASQKQPGSSVIITTRREDMARRMGCSYYQHYVAPLGQEDSWLLLRKQLTPDQVSL